MTWATDHLDALARGEASPPPVVQTIKLGTFDGWGKGWVKKQWEPTPELLNADGSLSCSYRLRLLRSWSLRQCRCGSALFRTLNLQLNFVRVGRAHPLFIEARVVAVTKQMITVRSDFRREDGELIADASAQQLIMPFAS